MDNQIDEWLNGRMDGQMDSQMDEWLNGRMDSQMDWWLDGYGWLNGCKSS